MKSKRAFDAEFIGRKGGVIVPEVGLIVLEDHPNEGMVEGRMSEVVQPSHVIDLNILMVMEQEGREQEGRSATLA